MPAYRIYHLDGAGRVDTAEWLEADDDTAAAVKASEVASKGIYVELWLGDRLIARLDRDGAISDAAG